MNQEVEKLILKSRINLAYENIEDPLIREEAVERLEKLLAENKVTNKMLLKHLNGAILPAIAVYGAMTAHGVPQEEAYNQIHDSAIKSAEGFIRLLHRAAKIPFFYPIFKLLVGKMTKKVFGPAGWDFRWKQMDDEKIAWDCHRCFYLDQLAAHNMKELTPIFCEVDDACYGSIPGIEWGRTKTLAKGGDVCDFCFINQKKK